MTALRAKRASSRECKVLAWHFERPSYSGAIKILGSAPHACYRFIKGPLAEIRMTIRASSRKAFEYRTRLTDNRIWDMFALRQGDVIVATPPKCGTTWTQALVLSLLFEKPGMDKVMDDLSVWLDPAFRDQLPIARMFEAQSHRRCIKTHTPFDGIPFDPDCTYIAVFRHPIDAHFSMRRHVANLKEDLIQDRFPDEPTASFALFLSETVREEMADGITLEAIVHHFKSFKSNIQHPNIHIFHYADMRRDLLSHTRKLASVLGLKIGDEMLAAIAESMQFENMQANARASAKEETQRSTTFKDPSAFFDSASSRKWEGKLSDEDLLAFHKRLAELLPEADARWLQSGGELPV